MHSRYPRCYFASLRMNCCGLQVSSIFDLVSDAPYAYQLPTSFRGLSQQKREKSLSRAFAMQARCTFCISYVQFFTCPFMGQKNAAQFFLLALTTIKEEALEWVGCPCKSFVVLYRRKVLRRICNCKGAFHDLTFLNSSSASFRPPRISSFRFKMLLLSCICQGFPRHANTQPSQTNNSSVKPLWAPSPS